MLYCLKRSLLLGIGGILIYLMPYILLGEDAFITIHDFLDGSVAHYKQIIELGLIGDMDGKLNVLDGVSAMSCMQLIPVDMKIILYIILPTYWAIVCNTFFVKLIAFWGMLLLCREYVVKGHEKCAFISALLFMFVPFYADLGLSSAGIPLFLYCCLNIENKKHLFSSYIVIAFFACNSSLALVGIFICFLWSGWIFWSWSRDHSLPKFHIIGLMLMISIYMFTNVEIIYNFFFSSNELSHRVEFTHDTLITNDLMQFFKYLFYSQYHAGEFNAIIILSFVAILFLLNWKKDNVVRLYTALYIVIVILVLLGVSVQK